MSKNRYGVTQREWRALRKSMAWHCGSRCYYCGARGPWQLMTIDHKIPFSRGGTNDKDNLVIACRSCNNRKKDMTVDEFPFRHPEARGDEKVMPALVWIDGILHQQYKKCTSDGPVFIWRKVSELRGTLAAYAPKPAHSETEAQPTDEVG